jgi:hypothetical protein
LAVLIGSQAVLDLEKQNNDKNQNDNDDKIKNKSDEEFSGSESVESLFDINEHVIYQELNKSNLLSTVIKDEKSKKFLYAPVLVCTIDYLVKAVQTTRGGRYILPSLRLMSSDLVIDEIDDFDSGDLIVIGRLIHLAGMLGRKVVISSATIPEAMAECYFKCYSEGWALYNATRPMSSSDIDYVCIIVSTFASFRVDNTEGRKVYDHDENLESHFSKIPNNIEGMERCEKGKIKFSFANLLYWHRPLAIVDEAHNNKSELSVEVLSRVNPSCIMEYTATPAKNSNVITSISASELKAEEMIKLPIILSEHNSWESAIHYSVKEQKKLEEIAKQENDYIRPIVLFKAEDESGDANVAAVKKYLTESMEIDSSEIAIATGKIKELNNINVLDAKCNIRYVITVEALKEGWDCPFAYVLCSVANIKSKTSIEQLLGRVLRMPYAKRRKNEYLNKAYAHVCSGSWEKAKDSICKGLISMGFEEQEAEKYTRSANPKDNVSRENAVCITDEDFSIPQLSLPDEEDYNSGWSLSDCDTTKIADEIEFDEKTKQCVIDIDNKKVTTQFLDKNNQLSFDLDAKKLPLSTKKDLFKFLNKELRMEYVEPLVLLRFIELAIENLLKQENLDIVKLYNGRLALKILLSSKIEKHRYEFYKNKFQEIKSKITICEEKFIFDRDNYPASTFYEGRYKFKKHYYTLTSDMNKEEEECANAIEQNENVKFWVRNLDRNGFWLPKEQGKFYPDFIVKLKDDRILIVEYKGEHLIENEDTKQKESIGELWAEKTGNLFLLGVKEDSDGKNIEFQIKRFLSKSIN